MVFVFQFISFHFSNAPNNCTHEFCTHLQKFAAIYLLASIPLHDFFFNFMYLCFYFGKQQKKTAPSTTKCFAYNVINVTRKKATKSKPDQCSNVTHQHSIVCSFLQNGRLIAATDWFNVYQMQSVHAIKILLLHLNYRDSLLFNPLSELKQSNK